MEERRRGRVKFWRDRGFGFIRMDDGDEVFIHAGGIRGKGRKDLSPGDLVEFEIATCPRGREARDVIVLEKQIEAEIETI